jgi:hypothetical protein
MGRLKRRSEPEDLPLAKIISLLSGRKARRKHPANVSFLLSSCLPKKQTK